MPSLRYQCQVGKALVLVHDGARNAEDVADSDLHLSLPTARLAIGSNCGEFCTTAKVSEMGNYAPRSAALAVCHCGQRDFSGASFGVVVQDEVGEA